MWRWDRKLRDADSPPQFRFHPGAYERSFEASSARCDVCRRPAGWIYTSTVYTKDDVRICAWCIAEGRLARHVRDRHAGFHDVQFDDVTSDIADELIRRTPGFSTFNPFHWPVHEGLPMAFLGYGDDERLWKDPHVQAAMTAAFEEEVPEGTAYALVFQALGGTAYHVEIDRD